MREIMRISILSFFVPFLILNASSGVFSADKVPVDGVVAQVNENYITIGDVMTILQPVHKQLAAKYSGAELKAQISAVFTNGLNSLIERRLILDAYQKQENKFPDPYLEGRVDEMVQDMFGGNKADFIAALAKEKINYDEWRNEMKEHVIASTMRKMNVEQNATVSSKAVRKAYDENVEKYRANAKVRLSMLMISKDASASQKAEDARKKLVEGADFAATVKAVGEGSKAEEGGDWGWIQPSKLRPELAELCAKLKKGEISQVTKVEDQFYILKVEDRQDSFADLQSQVENELRKAESERLYTSWIERLRKDAYVKIFDTGLF
jgi:peptidyl-prolyl cis-trans isomerase SurA